MSDLEQIIARQDALEARLEFQDETIAKLNDELAAQQRIVADLTKMQQLLIEKYRQVASRDGDGATTSDNPEDERPPHY